MCRETGKIKRAIYGNNNLKNIKLNLMIVFTFSRLMIGIGTTIPLLGIPWILGLLPNIPGITNNSELSWLSYIFVIFNASQVNK